jgi:hypothetical protein
MNKGRKCQTCEDKKVLAYSTDDTKKRYVDGTLVQADNWMDMPYDGVNQSKCVIP